MKKTMRFLSLAALALVGAVMTGCSNKDDVTVEPENKSNVVTLTTTVGIGGGAETRALAADGTKTFAAGETMAVIYNNGTSTVKAVSRPLEAGDIEDEGKSATFTFDLETPVKSGDVTYIYPAAMAGETDVDYSNLASQDGTLATLSSDLDLATYSGAWDGASLPSATLTNQLAFLAVTLKDADGRNDITSSITGLTITQDSYTYTITRDAAEGPIYVAIIPTSDDDITITATDGSKNYTKSLTGKTYKAGNGYNVSWRMTLPACSYTAPTLVGSTLTYNGSAQALVTGGSATNATIYYSTNGGSSWSTDVPTGTNAGNYTVYYKVEPADGYTGGVASTSLGTKTINKANGWCSLSPSSSSGWGSTGYTTSLSVSISHHGGALSITGKTGSQDLSASIAGNTLNLSRKNSISGTGTVTVTSAATTNYNAASATFRCNP